MVGNADEIRNAYGLNKNLESTTIQICFPTIIEQARERMQEVKEILRTTKFVETLDFVTKPIIA
jgi:hypothetical protein